MNTGFSTEFGSPAPEMPRPGTPTPRRFSVKRLFRLRLPLMLAVLAAVAVPGVLAVWQWVPAQFRASTLIRFSATGAGSLDDTRGPRAHDFHQFVATEVKMIEGAAMLLAVLGEPSVQRMEWLMTSHDPLAELESCLEARRLDDSDLVAIVVHAPVREDALTLVTAIQEAYMQYAMERAEEIGGSRLMALYDQRTELEEEVVRLTGKLREQRQALEGPMPEAGIVGQVNPYRHQYSQAQSDAIRSANEVRQREAMLDQLLALQEEFQGRPGNPIHAMDIEISVTQDPRVAALSNAVADAENEIATLEKSYQPDSPQLNLPRRKLEARRAELRQAEIEARRKMLEARISRVRFELAEAQSRLDDAEERTETFGQLIAGDEERALHRGQALENLRVAEQERDFAQERLNGINESIARIEVESKVPATVERAGVPSAPNAPDSSQRNRLLAAVLMAAGFAGLGAGLLREMTDQQVRTPLDVGFVTPLPVLAAIPLAATGGRHGDRPLPLLTAGDPGSHAANEFRRLLARVIYPSEGAAELNTCLIASATRGDGKTSIACNLAIALAQANRGVLLIDLCAHNPRAEATFGLERAEGLAEVLLGNASPNDLVRPANIENLFVLGPGLRSDALVGKLASRDIVEFLERAEEAFEHVIIDTPPALLMSDAKLLAPIVDGVFIVCGVGVTTLGMLRRCVNEFQESGAHLAGIVLNGMRPHAGGYLARNLKLYNAERHAGPAAGFHNGQPPTADDGEDVPMIILLDEERREAGATARRVPPGRFHDAQSGDGVDDDRQDDDDRDDEDEIIIEEQAGSARRGSKRPR